MKTRKIKNTIQKIIASIILVVVLNVTIPGTVHAEGNNFVEGVLLQPLVQLVASLGDIVIGLLNHYMLGTENLIDSVMLDKEDPNVDQGSLAVTGKEATTKQISEELDGTLLGDWKLPNMLYCPENIFANKIAMLDVNFINPHSFNAIQANLSKDEQEEKDNGTNSEKKYADEERESVAEQLNGVVASWYKAFRNIAIVGLLSVLIYIGIRILIESTAQEKAKYKERLQDWLVALCLVFVMQYIMSATLMVSEKVTQLFDSSGSTRVVLEMTGENANEEFGESKTNKFSTNLMGYMRFMAQRDNLGDAAAYTIIYVALVIFTVKFTFTYLKRVLYMAFFTMISPLVALTYPLDKIADGKAQAFNLWFKEYMMNALLQPVHLILYTALIGSAAELAFDNPIYALVAIGFLVPAEKFIKKMFRLDRGETAGGFGDFAAGAVTMSALKRLGSSNSGKSKGSGSEKDDGKIRTKKPITEDSVKNMSAFKNEYKNPPPVIPAPRPKSGRDSQDSDERQEDGGIYSPTYGPQQENTDRYSDDTRNEERNRYGDAPEEGVGSNIEGYNGQNYVDENGNLIGDGVNINNSHTDTNDTDGQTGDTGDTGDVGDVGDTGNAGNAGDANNAEDNEDNRTLTQWWNEDFGMRTPRQFYEDQKSAVSNFATSIPSRASDLGKRAIQKTPGLRRVPGMIGKIPAPVRNAARGLGKTAIRGVKTGAKGVWKSKGKIARTGAKIAGGVMGTVIGVGAGLTTGDASKVAQFATGGAAAGYAVGNTAANLTGSVARVGKAAAKKPGQIRNAYEEETYGLEYARQKNIERHNAAAKKEFMRDETEQLKYKQLAAKISKNGNKYTTQQVMEAAWDFKKANVDDDKMIERAIKIEAKRGNGNIGANYADHEKIINIAQEASKFDRSYIDDKEKRNNLEDRYYYKFGEKGEEEAMSMLASFYDDDGDKDYKNIRKSETAERNARRNPVKRSSPSKTLSDEERRKYEKKEGGNEPRKQDRKEGTNEPRKQDRKEGTNEPRKQNKKEGINGPRNQPTIITGPGIEDEFKKLTGRKPK